MHRILAAVASLVEEDWLSVLRLQQLQHAGSVVACMDFVSLSYLCSSQRRDGACTVSTGSESESRSVVSDSLRPHGLYCPWNSPGRNTGVGSLSLLQGNLPNPGIELGSPALQA